MFCSRSRRQTSVFVACPGARRACLLGALLAAPHAVADGDRPPSAPSVPAPATNLSSRAAASDAPLALPGFVRAVLESQPSLAAARAGVLAARARARRAGAVDDPAIELAMAPLSIGSAPAPFGFEASISQKLPWFGKRGLERSLERAEADAAQRDAESLETELGLAATLLYGRWFVAARSLEVNAAHVDLVRSLREAALARVASGRGSAGDALDAEAELIRLEREGGQLASERDVTQARMNELLHRPPEQPLPPPPLELGLEEPTGSSSSWEPERRADIQSLEQRAAAERARAERAERDAYPDLMLSLSYASMWDMPQHRFMLGLGFELPLHAERRDATAAEARATRAQLEHDADGRRDAARTGVFIATRQLAECRRALALFNDRLLPVARDRLELARSGFGALEAELGAVLAAERALHDVELEQQMAHAGCLERRAELEHALGRIPGLGTEARPR